MIRIASDTGWWLITHPDHARLAGAFAERWGNAMFTQPYPRRQVLQGIATHDDGWALRDAAPQITRAGLPAGFSTELVGKYSAFEEINLVDYIAVRERAVAVVAALDPYAALLVSLHTYNLLTERADRSTIQPEQLPLLDDFLGRQKALQEKLHDVIASDASFTPEETSWPRIRDHFRLLQATDNLSLLACTNYELPSNLLHALPTIDGATEVQVENVGARHFRLTPYPFAEPRLTFTIRARHVGLKVFTSHEHLQEHYAAAPVTELAITVTA
jgi:hypothetical protein